MLDGTYDLHCSNRETSVAAVPASILGTRALLTKETGHTSGVKVGRGRERAVERPRVSTGEISAERTASNRQRTTHSTL